MQQLVIGLILLAFGATLATVGGYIAKDGWAKFQSAKEVEKDVFSVHIGKGKTMFAFYEKMLKDPEKNVICIYFWDLEIINVSDAANSIRNVSLTYHLNGKKYTFEPKSVLTGLSYNIHDHKKKPTAIIQYPSGQAMLIDDWRDLRGVIYDKDILHPGERLKSSALFVLGKVKNDELKYIKEVIFEITDTRGGVHRKNLQLDTNQEAKGVFLNKRFTVDAGGKINIEKR